MNDECNCGQCKAWREKYGKQSNLRVSVLQETAAEDDATIGRLQGERDEARFQLARAREAVKRWRGGVSDAVLDEIDAALSTLPSPVSETGTGRRCVLLLGHRVPHYCDEADERIWAKSHYPEERCTHVEPPKGTP